MSETIQRPPSFAYKNFDQEVEPGSGIGKHWKDFYVVILKYLKMS